MKVKRSPANLINLGELLPSNTFELNSQYLMKTKSQGRNAKGEQTFVCVNLCSGEIERHPDCIVHLAPGHFQLD